MKKIIKENIDFVIAIVLIIIGIAWVIWNAISSLIPPDRDKMEKYFERDKADFALIVEYFSNSDYSYIAIDKSYLKKGVMFTWSKIRERDIDDEAVIKSLNRLMKKRGFSLIEKSHNTIIFKKWSILARERGIAFSINGEDKPVVQFLVKLEGLSEDGWYYYEVDSG